MKGYSARDIATMLGWSATQVRSYAAAGLLAPEKEDTGELRYSFHDLVLLRTAKELIDAQIPSRKVSRALKKLKAQLPSGRPLAAVRIAAVGDRIVVRDGGTLWNPDSGQALFDFSVSELETKVAPFARKAAQDAELDPRERSAEEWYELGCDLEIGAPAEAESAYRKALAIKPDYPDALVNLGRLLHEKEETVEAESLYRRALAIDGDHLTALFNLGVVLEDLGKAEEAITVYKRCTQLDPGFPDAHYNLAGLYEARGERLLAYEQLKTYKTLIDSQS